MEGEAKEAFASPSIEAPSEIVTIVTRSRFATLSPIASPCACGNAVRAPITAECPAWERFAWIPFTLSEMQQSAGRPGFLQAPKEDPGKLLFLFAHGGELPFFTVHVIDGNKRGFAAHGKSDIFAVQIFIDAVTVPVICLLPRRPGRKLFDQGGAACARGPEL